MIPEVNVISGKTSGASFNGVGECGKRCQPFNWSFRGWSLLRNLLGYKEHLDWLKTDLNAVKKILFKTINTQKIEVHVYSVKAKSQADNI